LFFRRRGSSKDEIGHVGIYIGHNLMIHATNPPGSVCLDDITKNDLPERLVAIGRGSTLYLHDGKYAENGQ